MTTQQAQTPVSKKPQAFFTFKTDKGRPVFLQPVDKQGSGSPDFEGTIDSKKVVGRIRGGANGKFIAFNTVTKTGEKTDTGREITNEEQIGTGNIVVVKSGAVRLTIKLNSDKNETIWVNVSNTVSDEMLFDCGLNFETRDAKRDAAEKLKAEKALEAESEMQAA
jgi:hypothetical protein